MEQESDVEHYFVKQCKKFGYLTYKFVSPGQAGVPDRVSINPVTGTCFIEFKKNTNEYPRPLQFYQLRKIEDYGEHVEILRSKSEVDWFFTGKGDYPVPFPVLQQQARKLDES